MKKLLLVKWKYINTSELEDYKLIDMPNVLATPHTAGATFEVEDHHVNILNRQLLAWAKQEQTTVLSNH